MKKFCVFSLRVATELVNQGYQIIDTGINLTNTKYRVFYFEDTQKLREAVKKITV